VQGLAKVGLSIILPIEEMGHFGFRFHAQLTRVTVNQVIIVPCPHE